MHTLRTYARFAMRKLVFKPKIQGSTIVCTRTGYYVNILLALVFAFNLIDLQLTDYSEVDPFILRSFQSFIIATLTLTLINQAIYLVGFYRTARIGTYFIVCLQCAAMVLLFSNRTDIDLVAILVLFSVPWFLTGGGEKKLRLFLYILAFLGAIVVIGWPLLGFPLFQFEDIFYEELRTGTVVLMLLISIALALIGRNAELNRIVTHNARIEAERARMNLQRYFSPNIVGYLEGKSDFEKPRRQYVASFFTDIIGFTQFSESHSPEEVMEMLRGFHGLAEPVFFENSGTMEKYIGDAALVNFGVPEESAIDCSNALSAGLALLSALEEYNKAAIATNKYPIDVGIGIHYGPAVLGDVGSRRSAAFTTIGDTINVASRLQSLTREYKTDLIISDDLVQKLLIERESGGEEYLRGLGFVAIPNVVLKGRTAPITIWKRKRT